jgi:trimeric autotransporter adhesin
MRFSRLLSLAQAIEFFSSLAYRMQRSALWMKAQKGLGGVGFALATALVGGSFQASAQQLQPAYVLNQVAGKGTNGSPYTGDGGPALLATAGDVVGVLEDNRGDVYFTDITNCVVRVVYNGGAQVAKLIALENPGATAVLGDVYTVAGISDEGGAAHCGHTGDGGLGTSAELFQPYRIGLDNSGNLLIADYDNNAIRDLNLSTGILTTIAGTLDVAGKTGDGGLPAAALLSGPQTVTVDQYGNILIADFRNNKIRQINFATGNINTIVGNGTASATGAGSCLTGIGNSGAGCPALSVELDGPDSSVDAAGNIYIGNQTSNEVLEINGQGNSIVIAGDATLGKTLGAGDVAIASELNEPHVPVADFLGNVYFPEQDNSDVRMVNSAGIISTPGGVLDIHGAAITSSGILAASTAGELFEPGSIHLDWADNLFITNADSYQIVEMSYNTGQPTTAVGATSAAQNVFVQTSTAITPATAVITPSSPAEFTLGALTGCALGTALPANTPCETTIAFAPAYPGLRTAQLTFTDSNGNLSPIGLSGIGTAPQVSFSQTSFTTLTSAVSAPRGGVVDSSGNVYFADSGNNVIRKITSAGVMSIVAGTSGKAGYSGDGGAATSATLRAPAKVAIDFSGDLFIADTGNNVIREVNAATGVISTVAGNGTAGYSGDAGLATAAELNAPQGVAVDPGGRVYVADTGNNVIRYFGASASGLIVTIIGNHAGVAGYAGDGGPAGNAELNAPTAITVDPYGDIYIADTGNDVVRVVTAVENNLLTFGNISTLAGVQGQAVNGGAGGAANAATLDKPSDIAVDAAGDAYITAGGQVFMVNTVGTLSVVAGTGATGTYSGDGNLILSTVLPAPASNIALDGAANLYVFDTAANLVLKAAQGTPQAINYGIQAAGTTGAATTFSVLNTGNSPLTFSGISTSNTAFILSSSATTACTLSTTLAAGQSCTLSMAFSPSSTANGAISGTLTLTDNALNGTAATQTIALSGSTKVIYSTTTTISTTPASLVYGGAGTITATIASSSSSTAPTGTISFTVYGVSEGSLPVSNGQASYTVPSLPASGAATVVAVYSGDANNNSSTATASVKILPAVLQVTATNATIAQTQSPSALTYTITGFVNGDTSSVVTGAPTETTTATSSSAQGTYPITLAQGTLVATNYTFVFVNGMLTVGPPPPPSFTLAISPTTMTVNAGSAGTLATLTMTPLYGYSGTAAISCTSAPAGIGCTSNGPLTGGGASGTPSWSQIRLFGTGSATASAAETPMKSQRLWLAFGMPLCLTGLMFGGRGKHRWSGRLLSLLLLAILTAGATSCSKGVSNGGAFVPGTYVVTVTAADSTAKVSQSATITITAIAP